MGTAWTISVEFFFYLSFPLLIRPIMKASLRRLAGLAVACAVLMVGLATPMHVPLYQAQTLDVLPLPAFRLVEFVYGMVLARLFLLRAFSMPKWSAPVLVLAVMIITSTTTNNALCSAAMVLGGLALIPLAADEEFIGHLLASRALQLLGGASFALYMVQVPVRAWLSPAIHDMAVLRIVNPIAALLLSILIFLCFERPVRVFILNAFVGSRHPPVVPASRPHSS